MATKKVIKEPKTTLRDLEAEIDQLKLDIQWLQRQISDLQTNNKGKKH